MSRSGQVLVLTTRWLFFAASLIWLVVASLVMSGVVSIGEVQPMVTMGLVGLMVAAAAILFILGLRCFKGNPLVDWIALAVAVVNVVLTLTDHVGAADVIYLLFSLVLLGTFSSAWIAQRRAYPEKRTKVRIR